VFNTSARSNRKEIILVFFLDSISEISVPEKWPPKMVYYVTYMYVHVQYVHHIISLSLALLCVHLASCHSNGEGLNLIR
jgi:hypothetical protein